MSFGIVAASYASNGEELIQPLAAWNFENEVNDMCTDVTGNGHVLTAVHTERGLQGITAPLPYRVIHTTSKASWAPVHTGHSLVVHRGAILSRYVFGRNYQTRTAALVLVPTILLLVGAIHGIYRLKAMVQCRHGGIVTQMY